MLLMMVSLTERKDHFNCLPSFLETKICPNLSPITHKKEYPLNFILFMYLTYQEVPMLYEQNIRYCFCGCIIQLLLLLV